MKIIKGRSTARKTALGRITGHRLPFGERRHAILATKERAFTDIGYAAVISEATFSSAVPFLPPHVVVDSLEGIPADDVVSIAPDGDIRFLWETGSRNNALLLTEACNCRCLMCPQPPKPFDARQVKVAGDVLELSAPGFTGEICLTGGEPTLCGDRLFEILVKCGERHPQASLMMLTNGKRFSEFDFAKRFAGVGADVKVAVSLHADVDTLHDRIVGSTGSFRKTQQGLYNLAKFGQCIEIRVVVSRLNHERLVQIARHIYRNYPFVAHVTFMALEITGHARDNHAAVWADPFGYGDTLEKALHELHRAGLRVSAYNHPLCLLPKAAWPFARKSISTWKNSYEPVCGDCSMRTECCGIFTTSGTDLSPHLKSISE
ncbi:MAG: His-Xaa-Ser system radical SAM maturase HxsC [Proteobacteria bacterium]|nr:His-Xaa-Ser system radical SAM maturase HxsC [Pseudomonadota bacterium]MBU1595086.1 His-Xaa-Ser system radical SAM maturase HxsC [Pseudomonadota bacterium]